MNYLYLYGGAIGDTLLGIHLGRTLAANEPGAKLIMVSTRSSVFAQELAATVPFIAYQELSSKNIASWFKLAPFASKPWKSAVYEPFNAPLSNWWKIILWCASRRAGSIQVRLRIRQGAAAGPRTRVIVYDPRISGKLFDTQADILEAWGVSAKILPQPMLEASELPPIQEPYIVFHFFAGHVRRSIPIGHARDILAEARTQFPGHSFIVTCAPNELADAKRVADGFAKTDILPGLQAPKLLQLLSRASSVVGTASGVIHLAAHLGAPTVALCNLSDPCWLPSYNSSVILLSERRRCKCNGDKTGDCGIETPEGLVYACLYDITTGSVIDAMKQKINPHA